MRKLWWVYVLISIGLIAMLFPFFSMVLSAFKSNADVYVYPPKWFPSQWNFDNFKRVFEMVPFALYFFNSLLVTVLVTYGQLFISVLAAFALSRLKFPFKNAVFMLIVSTMLMPFVVTMIPVFLIVSAFRWIDTYQGLVIPSLFSGFSIIFLRQFFISIPQDLQDAAMIDGCGFFRILFQVILPNAKPAIATITLFNFLGEWRNYLWPLIVTNSTKMRTLPVGLRYLMTEGGGEYHLMMAASLMAILPVLIVYLFSEKQFIKSVAFTGLKS